MILETTDGVGTIMYGLPITRSRRSVTELTV